jgi:hypothetical protein
VSRCIRCRDHFGRHAALGRAAGQNVPKVDYISWLEGTIDELWNRLAFQCCDWTWFLREALDYALTSGALLTGATWSAIGNILGGSPVVLDEMVPGSAFHADINGGWNIAHEFADVGPGSGLFVADAYW